MIWLLTAVWFGLLTGSVEVVLRGTLQMSLLDIQLFYGPHFVWMAPLSEAILFALVTGSLLLGARLGSRRASPRAVFFLLVCLAVLTLVCMVPGLHPLAALFVAAGVAAHVSRELTKRTPQVMEMVRRSVGRVLAAVALLALGVFGWEKLAEKRALASLPPAAPGAPNVLLLVLDTVRAQNLSAYGYARPTSPRITALANRGVRFEHAISTAPWTTPSHFSMMTGRFPHELIAHWQDALDDTHPTLAEVLGAAGYVSGGFVANMEYAGYESGLDRGFVHFEDYPVSPAELALSSSLAHAILNNQALRNLIGEHQILGRKLAEDVNRDFLDWLSRQDPERPFFAFLNYFDAHSIYLPPDPWDAEFGSEAERDMTGTWHFKRRARHRLKDRTATPAQIQVELDSYDGSIAYVDHEVGRLLDELERRRILDDTIVVVTADHGEHFGEHDRFGHDNSLYRQLVQVPLVIRFPARAPAGAIVSEPVSLRDLPATLLDLAGLGRGGIGGASLASLWGETVPAETSRTIMSEWAAGSLTPRGLEANPGRLEHALDFLRVKLGMEAAEKRELEVLMKSLVADDHHYIRNGDGTEELYHFGSDPAEVQDLARSGQADTHLVRFRTSLRRILAPHLPSTSNPEVSFR